MPERNMPFYVPMLHFYRVCSEMLLAQIMT